MANRIAATYTGSADSSTHTITWSAPTAGARLIVCISSWFNLDSIPSGWTQDANITPYNNLYVLSKIATSSDTGIILSMAGTDPRVHVVVYERDDCADYAFQASATGTTSSLSAVGTVPSGASRVFAITNNPSGSATPTWNQGLTSDYVTAATSNNSAFASGAAPSAGSQTFTASGLSAGGGNDTGLLVVGYSGGGGGGPSGGGTGQALLRAVSQSTGTAGASYNIAPPAGTTEGDILVMFHMDAARTVGQSQSISGGGTWTLLGSVDSFASSSADAATSVWWRRAGPSEPATYTVTRAGSAWIGMLAAVSGARTDAPPTAASPTSSTTSGQTSVQSPAGSPTGAGDLELRFVAADPSTTGARSFGTPGGYTESLDLQVSSRTVAQLVWAAMTGSSPTSVVTHTISGSSVLATNGWTVNIPAAPLLGVPPVPIVSPMAAAVRAARW